MVTTWVSYATSFETPTTTELANRIEGDGGFNTELDPQRTAAAEAGVRAAHGPWRAEFTAYRAVTRDALIAFREIAGRSYFRNAGQTRTTGIEAAGSFAVTKSLTLLATLTHTDAVFSDYVLTEGTETVDLAGRRLAGVPSTVARVGLQGMVHRSVGVDVDHAWSSETYADDRNFITVPGWGWGVTSIRARWTWSAGRYRVEPFAGLSNVFNRSYVASVTINGAAGRVFEPSPGRTAFVGSSIGI